ncbi:hypothetical protein GQ43DRAFT_440599 [Delitschia confertaspora ATCC 74209]|uniref:Uncharacterized protein n=1 Tax=Delitschia confertaspora ATCC 74209 TaxID=1513339 RepID=A0A9P4JL08_9PLEO|nr:hypothetical protein GQ43DRAFT_440599 [Delitschia confertaspora ATCC 74209]
MHPDRLTTTILSKALHYFSKALYYLKQDPSTSSKQYSRLYQKLMDTSLRLSMLCHSSPSERKEYADQAKEYGEAALINAMRVGDECMVAQIQFHLACASVWKVYLAARRAGVEPRAFPAREEVEVHVVERLGVLQRFGNLEMGWFEEQAEKFLGYLSSPSGTG